MNNNNQWHWCILLIGISLAGISSSKELRPSDHGLTNDGAAAASPQMSTFFGGGASSTTTQPLPEARNFSDSSWNNGGEGGGGGGGDHVRKVLIVSSLVCGTAGVALLAVVGFLVLISNGNQLHS
ncbi:hypothetical protein M8C21_024301 [Ambrosia artemisiifolia]|uniref:Transmembrane protein n=1 Tax=Ambrosia artemisiifolia TaxID=4212 RepID=A0AAD5CHW0_AMBAR|nr:hypothetical protein M8C21_024301 [Ambrosia artemisiifolia]